jgi:hypothetical protein
MNLVDNMLEKLKDLTNQDVYTMWTFREQIDYTLKITG